MKPEKKLNLGERLEIVPNNATLVVNIHDRIYGVRNGMVEEIIPVPEGDEVIKLLSLVKYQSKQELSHARNYNWTNFFEEQDTG